MNTNKTNGVMMLWHSEVMLSKMLSQPDCQWDQRWARWQGTGAAGRRQSGVELDKGWRRLSYPKGGEAGSYVDGHRRSRNIEKFGFRL